MTWSEHHRRGDVLRTVVESLDVHRDGRLPVELPGVAETFADDLDLLGALQLTWYQRLMGLVERLQSDVSRAPRTLESSVEEAWLEAARWMPGLRVTLDRHVEHPTSEAMGRALSRAVAKERAQLALLAGLASAPDARAATVGLRIETAAREQWRPGASIPAPTHRPADTTRAVTTRRTPRAVTPARATARPAPARRTPTGSAAFVARLKAALEA